MLKETDFIEPGELEKLVRCKQLVEKMLEEQYRILNRLRDVGKETKYVEVMIARLEYALGLRKNYPNIKQIIEGR